VGDRLRVGVVGCGMIAQVMHLHYLTELRDRFEIAALCDVSEPVARACADRYGVPVVHTRWQDLVAERLDVVMVLTSGSHAPVAIAAGQALKIGRVQGPGLRGYLLVAGDCVAVGVGIIALIAGTTWAGNRRRDALSLSRGTPA